MCKFGRKVASTFGAVYGNRHDNKLFALRMAEGNGSHSGSNENDNGDRDLPNGRRGRDDHPPLPRKPKTCLTLLRRELVSELKGNLKKVVRATEDDEPDEPPFVQDILDAPISQKSGFPTFNKYDGTKDPVDHVETYEFIMDFHAYSDAMKCRALSITLQGPARKWFRLLASYSISSLKQLRKAFIAQFAAHKDAKHSDTDYIKRFLSEQIKVETCTDLLARSAFCNGVTHEKLSWSLAKKPELTLKGCLDRATKFIEAEDIMMSKEDKYSRNGSPSKIEKNKDKKKNGNGGNGRGNSFCLIRQGYFKKYVGKRDREETSNPSSSRKEQKRERSKTLPKREDQPPMIHTIPGGSSDGQSGHKRKELAGEAGHEVCMLQPKQQSYPIIFSDVDLQGVHFPHNDALVIALLIDHITMRRVLIDGRASTNILSLSTYKALEWGRAQLKKSPTPLVGFSGESVTPGAPHLAKGRRNSGQLGGRVRDHQRQVGLQRHLWLTDSTCPGGRAVDIPPNDEISYS
ncbi:uncharacterized protein LOC111018172 [Momordica charantia]|uniref:Uncharacterized protein LOC111018172 n=1 Tax=Momordica charantia TaxID=3673 RepID=A0A6J1D9M1_MOMCH|nr:uncharacterized protein LOC111018172 [Momordica charantia]